MNFDPGVNCYHLAKQTFDAAKTAGSIDSTRANLPFIDSMFIDYEKNFHVPHLFVAQFYYSRKFNIYNFGVVNTREEEMKCYLWGQDMGKQGQNETASVLLEHLNTTRLKAEWIIIWADSSSRQNKHYLMLFLFNELVRVGSYRRMDYKFPQVGHTFLPNDRWFGVIERCRNKQKIFVPNGWKKVVEGAISNCEKTGKKIVAKWLHDQSVFKHYSKYFSTYFSTTSSRTIKGVTPMKKVNLSNMFWMNFGWGEEWSEQEQKFKRVSHIGEVWFKDNYDVKKPWIKCVIARKRNVRAGTVPPISIVQPKFNAKIALSAEKVDDLRKLKKFVPERYHWFYPSGTSKGRGEVGTAAVEATVIQEEDIGAPIPEAPAIQEEREVPNLERVVDVQMHDVEGIPRADRRDDGIRLCACCGNDCSASHHCCRVCGVGVCSYIVCGNTMMQGEGEYYCLLHVPSINNADLQYGENDFVGLEMEDNVGLVCEKNQCTRVTRSKGTVGDIFGVERRKKRRKT